MSQLKTPKYQRGAIYNVEVVVPGYKGLPTVRYIKQMKLIDTRKDGVLVMEERFLKPTTVTHGGSVIGFDPLARDAVHQIYHGQVKHVPAWRQILVKRSRVKGLVSAPLHVQPSHETEAMAI